MYRFLIVFACGLAAVGLVRSTAAFLAIATRIGVSSFRYSLPVFRTRFLHPWSVIKSYKQQGETKYLNEYLLSEAICACGVLLILACVIAR